MMEPLYTNIPLSARSHPVAFGFIGGVILPIMLVNMMSKSSRMTKVNDKGELENIKGELSSIQRRVTNVDDYMNAQMDVPGSVVAEAAGLWN